MEKLELVLTNGNKYEAEVGSSITYLTFEFTQFADIDTLNADITEDNMKSVTLGGISYSEIIPLALTAEKLNDIVRVVVQAREKTFEEKTQELLAEHADALMELAGGLE